MAEFTLEGLTNFLSCIYRIFQLALSLPLNNNVSTYKTHMCENLRWMIIFRLEKAVNKVDKNCGFYFRKSNHLFLLRVSKNETIDIVVKTKH